MGMIRALMILLLLSVSASAQDEPDNLEGFGFGVALGVTWDFTTADRVADASIDPNGIVRVDRQENAIARFLLETHYFIPIGEQYGWGPFVSVQPGSDNIVEAVAAGLMFGMKRIGENASLNLGIGYELTPRTQILGEEFIPGELAPLDPTGAQIPIRFKELAQGGLMMITSFSWQ